MVNKAVFFTWLKLAEQWKSAFKDNWGEYQVNYSYGLCTSIGRLSIGKIVQNRMISKINKLRNRFGLYKWKLTKYGAKSRVKYCLKQAELLNKK